MKYLTYALTIIAFAYNISTSVAQRIYLSEEVEKEPCPFNEKIVLDSVAQLECIYAFTEVDSVLERARNHELMVQIGNKSVLQADLNEYLCDSVFRARNYQLTVGEALDVHAQYHSSYSKLFYRSRGLYHERENLITDNVAYADSGAIFNWMLADDTLTVCGYLCHKATAHFRGRTWTAWYTEQIPVDAGPWKFNGLPGLILKATDNNVYHDFEAITVRKPHTLAITCDIRKSCLNVKREKFRAMEEDVANNALDILKNNGLIQSTSAKEKRMFYSPLELE